MFKYEFHPLSKSLPLMWGSDFDDFVNDIKQNGQIVPISVFEGQILDGRNRYRACKQLGIEGKFEKVTPKNAKAYVTSINVHRRQLTREQRSEHLLLLIAKQDSLQMTNAEVAKAADVSEKTVQRKKREVSKKPSEPPLLSSSPAPKVKTPTEPAVDYNLTPIPAPAMPYWNRKPEAKNVLNQISAARGQVKKLMPDDPMWSNVNLNGVIADLSSAFNRFTAAIPEFVCPICKGEKPDDCKCCKGKGVVSKFVWKQIPDDMKPKSEHPF
jgi:ribosomal protein L24